MVNAELDFEDETDVGDTAGNNHLFSDGEGRGPVWCARDPGCDHHSYERERGAGERSDDPVGYNNAPAFDDATAEFMVDENMPMGTDVGMVMATDEPTDDTLTYSVDSMYFDIDEMRARSRPRCRWTTRRCAATGRWMTGTRMTASANDNTVTRSVTACTYETLTRSTVFDAETAELMEDEHDRPDGRSWRREHH